MGNHIRNLVRAVIEGVDLDGRLKHLPAIREEFPRDLLASFSDRPPFYCHFMEWRLATLPESCLRRFDELLAKASSLHGWENEVRSLRGSSSFAEFWSLIWQLQAAEFLSRFPGELRWLGSGPDLHYEDRAGRTLFVECICPRKHFATYEFIDSLVRRCHPCLNTTHQLFMRQVLPRGAELDNFLSELLEDLQDEARLTDLQRQAESKHPVVIALPEGSENLTVYFEGVDIDAYDPMAIPQGAGPPEPYYELILREALNNKTGRNSLASHRPNALLVNFLIGSDQQVIQAIRPPPALELPNDIEHLVWASIGIDQSLEVTSYSALPRDPFAACLNG